MSYYAQFDNGGGNDVATNSGWLDFSNWVEELEGADELRHLTDYGWSEHLDDVAAELESAIEAGDPAPDVASTAQGLLGQLQQNHDADVLVVTDGTGVESDGDGDGDGGGDQSEDGFARFKTNGHSNGESWLDKAVRRGWEG